LYREPKITDDAAVFKTLSPFLIRDYADKDRYLKPGDREFAGQLAHIVSECTRSFIGRAATIEFEDVKTETFPVLHYGMSMDAVKGVFALKGDPDVLTMVYQIAVRSD
jgi:CRISPR-associated endoribonuclease Cas6